MCISIQCFYYTSSELTAIYRLQEEKRTWDDLLASTVPPKPSAETADAESSSQPLLDVSPQSINPSLLDPSQADHLQALLSSISLNSSEPTSQTSTLETTKTRIGTIASSLEFKIDKLADGAHKLEQYTAGAQRLADRVLAVGAEKLEERDKSVREKSASGQIDAMDKLRGLSRVLNKRG
jgi:kinetochore protein Mis13/DSN1